MASARDLLQVDIKPLGRIAGVGHRIDGDRRARVAGIGWEYVHVAVDDHSRVAYVELLADQLGTTCAAFLQCARLVCRARDHRPTGDERHRERLRLPRVSRRVRRRWAAAPADARLYAADQWKAERFIQTLQREWA